MAGMSNDDSLTKKDVEEIVSRVVGDSLQLISKEFENVKNMLEDNRAEVRAEFQQIHATSNRIENKLDATVELTDQHSVEIHALKQKIA